MCRKGRLENRIKNRQLQAKINNSARRNKGKTCKGSGYLKMSRTQDNKLKKLSHVQKRRWWWPELAGMTRQGKEGEAWWPTGNLEGFGRASQRVSKHRQG